MAGKVRVGLGGWTFPPWRGVFYPAGLRQGDELAHAASRLTAIEINATYHATQSPERFAAWAAATPETFVFSVKASRSCTNRRVLAESGEAVARFLGQGLVELGPRLGPILWQLMPTKRYDADDIAAFLALLPPEIDGLPLRHCIEARHESFATPTFVAQCRAAGVAICCAEDEAGPRIADPTADFVYARLMRGSDDIDTGYGAADLDLWAGRLVAYAAGGVPADLPLVGDAPPASPGRDVFAFFIRSGKVRAPAAALAIIDRLAALGL